MRELSFVSLIVVMVLLFPDAGSGQGKKSSIEHLKKPNPNELYVSLNVDPECPAEDYMSVVEGELLRARINRLPYWNYDEVTLFIVLTCKNSTETSLSIYDIDASFGTFRKVTNPADDEYGFMYVYFEGADGVFGYIGTDKLKSTLRTGLSESVYRILTKYLKANFGL